MNKEIAKRLFDEFPEIFPFLFIPFLCIEALNIHYHNRNYSKKEQCLLWRLLFHSFYN